MAKRPNAWMPLYIGDYLRDTSRLTTEGHGAYLLLIFDYWASGKPLPDDDSQLAAVTRLAVTRWKALRPVVAGFFQIGDGLWHHKRIDSELQSAADNTSKRAAAGRRGAVAKWSDRDGKTDGNAIPDAMRSQCDNDGPSPSPRKEDSEADASGAGAPVDPVRVLWGQALEILGQGQRSLIGKMRKEYGDVALLEAIVETKNECPSDPPSYFVACCQRRKGNGRSAAGHAGALDILARAALDFDERQSHRGHPQAAH